MAPRKVVKACCRATDSLVVHFDQQALNECRSPGQGQLVPLTWPARKELERASKEREVRRQRVARNRKANQLRREKRVLENKKQWDAMLANASPVQIAKKRPRPTSIINLCRCGIPAFLRGPIWLALSGDALGLTLEKYNKLVQQSDPALLKQLQVDIPRTFPHLAFYHSSGNPLAAGMVEVLSAYSAFNRETGYIQGMTYIAGVLLLYMEPYESFVCMANMIHSHRFFGTIRKKPQVLENHLQEFDKQFKTMLPNLYHYFVRLGITTDMYLLDWIFTMFSKSLPLNVVARIWDCYLVCTSEEMKETLLWRVALGLLRMLEPILLTHEVPFILKLLKVLPDAIDEDDYLEAILDG